VKTKIIFVACFTFCFLFLSATNLCGQKVLKDTMVNVVKSFQPTIADAYKINDPPAIKDSIPTAPQLVYFINSKNFFTPFTVETLRPAKMVGEPLTKLYPALIKVGFGNYYTPYAEIFYNNLRSKDMAYGAHLKHFSSKADMEGYGFGGLSDNQIEFYGKKFLRKHTLSGNLDYNRNVIHYYGYDTSLIPISDNDYIKQRYSNIGGNVSLQSHYTDSVHTNYFLKLNYYNLMDFYNTSENNIYAYGDFNGYYEKQLIHVPVTVDYYNHKSTADTSNSVLIGLAPYLTAKGDKWSTRIGVGISIEGNQNNKSRFLFYPNIDFNYNVVANIIVPYAGITGGLKKNSLKTLTDENPFLVPNPSMKNTNEKWEMYAGLRGSISKTLSYSARTSYKKSEDMYFFVNDNSDLVKKGFNVLYQDANVWNLHGELQFQSNEKIKLFAKGDYNSYLIPYEKVAGTLESKPWHRPALQLTFSANYNLKNKIVVNADVFFIGNRQAVSATNGIGTNILVNAYSITTLKSIVDANLSLEYRYSKKLSAFLNFNNLGFKRYEIWNNYPSYKFNFLAGVSVIF